MLDEELLRTDPEGAFVTCLGFVRHSELPTLLSGANLFIFASSCENMPNTLVEAMAAGLPSVVSDWDGYRDGPRHGEEGFLVPTWLAPAGSGDDLARRYQLRIDDYDHYIAHASQFAAVEVAPMARAFETLISRPDLCKEMGSRARRRAVAVYDWPVVIAQYAELWTELAARRAVDAESAPLQDNSSAVPHHTDPFALFAGYPSEVLGAETLVSLAPGADAERLRERTSLFMTSLSRALLCQRGGITAILGELADPP